MTTSITQLSDRQRQALLGGKSVQWAADAFGVPRPRLVAMIAAAGLVIDPATDKVHLHRPVATGIHTAKAGSMSDTPTVLEALRSGTPIAEVAAAHGWTDQALRALVNGQKGWTFGADGRVLRSEADPRPVATAKTVSPRPSEPTSEPAAPKSTPAELVAGGIEHLLADARDSGDKRIERAAARVDAAVETLLGLHEPWLAGKKEADERAGQLAKAEDRAAELRAQLAEAQAEVAALKGKPARTAPKGASSPSQGRPKAIRAWAAAARGIEVSPRGIVPRHVVEQYDAAHQEAPDGA